eukprot:1146939-Pelagomonas_calceolata.AAC.5
MRCAQLAHQPGGPGELITTAPTRHVPGGPRLRWIGMHRDELLCTCGQMKAGYKAFQQSPFRSASMHQKDARKKERQAYIRFFEDMCTWDVAARAKACACTADIDI